MKTPTFLVYLVLSLSLIVADRAYTLPYRSQEIVVRDYYAPVAQSDKEDLSYIINTMGMGSLAKIAKSKSSLKKAGKRIDHLHPFNFLLTIFLDEEMKVSMQAMKSRLWVWSEFMAGVKGSFTEEAAKGNLKMEYIEDFAAQLNIDVEDVLPSIESKDWNQLVKVLLKIIPWNEGDGGRYDM